MSLQEEFEQLSAEAIAGFPALAKEEHLQLDFKRIKNANLNGTDDKKSLASCISGFANSSGGIVIWGIDARKNDQGIDCANEIHEINPLGIFLSRLNELSSQAVSPPVDGIVHKKFETSPNRGFAATLIPESDSGPHMAKLGENRYYKRNGQQFLQLEHFDLEDMFGRRQKPHLELFISSNRMPTSDVHEVLEIRMKNVGKALARHVGFFATIEGATILNVQHFENVSAMNEGKQAFYYENNHSVFHPNGIRTALGKVTYVREKSDESIKLNVHYFCEYFKGEHKSYTIAPEPPLAVVEPVVEG